MEKDCLGREINIGDYVCIAGKQDGCGSSGYRPIKLYFGLITRITKNGTPMCKCANAHKDYAVNGEHAMIVPKDAIVEKYPNIALEK